ncbi:SepM family pheromone-processing serine protease [Metabacillus schmidteae]|uniref:SepM family pheromone-processing serine protease n=1 Tax=Metabacillus schmidteae TaxID=2730405 RepID=UPI00158C0879|nr:SepM family pheromone-processing serine protease [Metabacillus schmidteae]
MSKKSFKPRIKRFLLIMLVLVIIAFIPTPYYLYQPGPMEELAPIIKVEDGYENEEGSFHLTTVLQVKANPYLLVYGLIAPNTDIMEEESVKGDLSDSEYNRLLDFMMKDSQQNALVAAFKAAGEDVAIDYKGIFVRGILSDSPAKDVLEVGDIITSVDGNKIVEAPKFIEYIQQNKNEGDQSTLTVLRGDEELKKTVDIIKLDDATGKVGIGIAPEEEFTATIPKEVNITSEDIGGPSAGLMFSLEILNQLTPDDLTKGFKVAGTGTIDHNGNVGQIGGITHKVIAAEEEGADIFFAPKDLTEIDQNEKDAIAQAKDHGYNVKIVPVATLSEAIEYLEGLEERK